MRPIVAALIWIVLVGGLTFYTHSREPVKALETVATQPVEGTLALEITPSFRAEPDPFALRDDTERTASALTIRVNGKEALRVTDRTEPGRVIRVEPVPGLIRGENEIYLEVNPPLSAGTGSHAVRVRVLQDGRKLQDRTFWSEPGSRIVETFRVKTVPEPQPEKQDHGH